MRPQFDLIEYLYRLDAWATKTFGPQSNRVNARLQHIRLELDEIEADPADLEEWVDVVILALGGAMRAGYSAEQVAAAIEAKQAKNEARKWPDWRESDIDRPILHVKEDPA